MADDDEIFNSAFEAAVSGHDVRDGVNLQEGDLDFEPAPEERYATFATVKNRNRGTRDGLGLRDDDFNLDPFKNKARTWALKETAFYDEYRRLLFESSTVSSLVWYLTNQIAGPSYRFVGDDEEAVQEVEDFWFENDMADKLEKVVMQAILLGTGVGAKSVTSESEQLAGFKRVDAQDVRIERDTNGDEEVTQKSVGEPLGDKAFVLRFRQYPDTPYGISFVRPALLGLQGIEDIMRDIPAAVKQLAYVDRVLKLDLSDVGDKSQKKKIMQNARDSFDKYDSANTTVVVMDKDNEFGYMGSTGSGGGQSRIDPIMDIAKPIMLWVLFAFNVPAGQIIQEDANRATIEQQKILAQKQLDVLREKFARKVEKELIAPLLGEDGKPSVQIEYKPDPLPPGTKSERLLEFFKNDVISREELRRRMGFQSEVDGTMFSDTGAGEQTGGGGFSREAFDAEKAQEKTEELLEFDNGDKGAASSE